MLNLNMLTMHPPGTNSVYPVGPERDQKHTEGAQMNYKIVINGLLRMERNLSVSWFTRGSVVQHKKSVNPNPFFGPKNCYLNYK